MSAQTAAIIGAGAIGADWAARFALMGWEVRIFDPDSAAETRVAEALTRARASLPALYDVALPPEGRVSFHATLSETARGAVWIQECAPERLELKRKLFQTLQAHCDETAVIASASVGLWPDELQGCATRPGQILRVRALEGVYLNPVVEVIPGKATAPQTHDRAREILSDIGCLPMDLQAPLQASSLSALTDGPDRDALLVRLLRALKGQPNSPIGTALTAHEARFAPPAPDPDAPEMPVSLTRQVPITWVDYNGHMNEAFFLTAFSQACDQVLTWAGMDLVAVSDQQSIFTVETHIRHLDEVNIGEAIQVQTRIIEGGGKKLHIWQELCVDGRLCATGEQLLLHMDLTTRRSAPPAPHVGDWLGRMKQAQADLPLPEGFGRFVAQRNT